MFCSLPVVFAFEQRLHLCIWKKSNHNSYPSAILGLLQNPKVLVDYEAEGHCQVVQLA
jgi:hypothetical protein